MWEQPPWGYSRQGGAGGLILVDQSDPPARGKVMYVMALHHYAAYGLLGMVSSLWFIISADEHHGRR